MDPLSALETIFRIGKFLADAPMNASKNESMARDILRRLYVFQPLLVSIKSDCDEGRFTDKDKKLALDELCTAVVAAEEWINKNLQPKAGGVLARAKGMWHSTDNKEALRVIAENIDKAVSDLALVTAQADSLNPQTPQPATPLTLKPPKSSN